MVCLHKDQKKRTQIVQRSFPHMTNSVGLYSRAGNIILWPINHRSHGKTRLEGRGFHEQANSAALCGKTLVTLLPPFQFAGWHRLCILIVIFDTQYYILIYYIYIIYIYIYIAFENQQDTLACKWCKTFSILSNRWAASIPIWWKTIL